MMLVFLVLLLLGLQGECSARSMRKLSISTVFDVCTYGAIGDGLTDSSKAFAETWKAACASDLPSIVYVPEGNFLLNPVSFQGPCKAHNITVQLVGKLMASTNNSLWYGQNSDHWLLFKGVNRLTVEGGGLVDGQGASWWAESCRINPKNPCRDGPTSLRFSGCTDIVVRDITSINSKQVHINFNYCTNVEAYRLSIRAPDESPNTDGIHIEQSTNVNIRDAFVGTGDDCISVGSGSSNVLVERITCGPGHGISVGSLGKDRTEAGVHNVTVRESFLSGTQNGVRIKTWQGGKGFAKDFKFHNIRMSRVRNPIIIDQYYCPHSSDCTNQSSAVRVSDVSYNNISGTSASDVAMTFSCSETVACQEINLHNVQLSFVNGGGRKDLPAKSFCWNAEGTASGLVRPPSCLTSNGYRPPPPPVAKPIDRNKKKNMKKKKKSKGHPGHG